MGFALSLLALLKQKQNVDGELIFKTFHRQVVAASGSSDVLAMVSAPVDASRLPHGERCGDCAKECDDQGCKMRKCESNRAEGSGPEGEAEQPGETGAPALPPEADAKKAEGNTAFQAKEYTEALRLYGEAIAIAEAAGAPVPGVYYSNRAVCLASLEDWEGARADAAEALSRTDLTPAATKKALFQKCRAESRLQLLEDLEATLRLAGQLGMRAEVERLLGSELSQNAAPKVATPQPQASPAAPAQAAQAAPSVQESSGSPAMEAASQAKEAGTARYKDGDYRGALLQYRQALDLTPSDEAGFRAQLLGNIAASCLMLKRAGDCAAACEESLALDPSNSKVRARLASAQVARGDFDTARATLGLANEADSVLTNSLKQIGSTEATLAEADQALSRGEPAKALNMFANLESTALFDYPPLTLKMARCYLDLRQYPRVLNTTQQILRSNPTSIDALLLRTQVETVWTSNAHTAEEGSTRTRNGGDPDYATSATSSCRNLFAESVSESSEALGTAETGLCDACFDRYNTTCVRCNETIPDDELRYTSGLCDFCYKAGLQTRWISAVNLVCLILLGRIATRTALDPRRANGNDESRLGPDMSRQDQT
eukprot:s575_g30.t2